MTLFEKPADLSGPWLSTQSSYSYLARSNRREAAEARGRIDGWFSRYPEKHRKGLRGKFCSKRDIAHDSAFFELVLHEVLSKKGLGIVVEPTVPCSQKCPDFEIGSGAGRVVVEATSATGMTDRERGYQRNAEALLNSLRSIASADFYFDVAFRSPVTSLEGQSSACRIVREFLDRLVYDEVASGFAHWTGGPRGTPQEFSIDVNRDGFRIRVKAIPRGETRGVKDSALAAWQFRENASYRLTKEWIRGAVDEKANRYGTLGCSYVIAINVYDFSLSSRDLIHAALGSEQVKVTIDKNTRGIVQSEMIYGVDGSFGTPDSPIRKNVSAVVCTNHVSPWSVADRKLMMIHNPWADFPLPVGWLGCEEITVDNSGQIQRVGNQSLLELLEHSEPRPSLKMLLSLDSVPSRLRYGPAPQRHACDGWLQRYVDKSAA